jgi:hypothetical protein
LKLFQSISRQTVTQFFMFTLLLPLLLDQVAARRRRRIYIPDPTPEATMTFPATSTPVPTPLATPLATWGLPIKVDRYMLGIAICLSGIGISLVIVTVSVTKQCNVVRKSRVKSEGIPLIGGAPRGML